MKGFFIIITCLDLFNRLKCDLSLEIFENSDGSEKIMPPNTNQVVGVRLSLTCRIVNSNNNTNDTYQDNIFWSKRKADLRIRNQNDFDAFVHSSLLSNTQLEDVNESTKIFNSLSLADKGTYLCISVKHKLLKSITINVKDVTDDNIIHYRDAEILYEHSICHHTMFFCSTSYTCIHMRFVCDGKPDCRDESDENWEICNGDPCRGKLQCGERCIPNEWCCDRHRDPSCTVLVRPSCCWPLESLEPEYERNIRMHEGDELADINLQGDTTVKNSGTRYLFIIICIFSGMLSISLVLLIISKVCSFQNPRAPVGDNYLHINILRQFPPSNRRCAHSVCAIRRELSPSYDCMYQQQMNGAEFCSTAFDINNEDSNLLSLTGSNHDRRTNTVNDQPPSYTEAVNSSKPSTPFLIEVPPPSYATSIKLSQINPPRYDHSDEA